MPTWLATKDHLGSLLGDDWVLSAVRGYNDILRHPISVPSLGKRPLFPHPVQPGAQPLAPQRQFQPDLEADPRAAVPAGAVGCEDRGGFCLCGSRRLHSSPSLEFLSATENTDPPCTMSVIPPDSSEATAIAPCFLECPGQPPLLKSCFGSRHKHLVGAGHQKPHPSPSFSASCFVSKPPRTYDGRSPAHWWPLHPQDASLDGTQRSKSLPYLVPTEKEEQEYHVYVLICLINSYKDRTEWRGDSKNYKPVWLLHGTVHMGTSACVREGRWWGGWGAAPGTEATRQAQISSMFPESIF